MLPIHMFPKRFPSALRTGIVREDPLVGEIGGQLSVRVKSASLAKSRYSVSRQVLGPVGTGLGQFSSMPAAPRVASVFPVQSQSGFKAKMVWPDTASLNQDKSVHAAPSLQVLQLYGARSANWWTGKQPQLGVCPGMRQDGTLCSLPQLSLSKDSCTRESLQAYFDNTWAMTEVLFASLQGEEAFMRSPYHDLRHPLIFYYGHPACLYINKLRVAGLLTDPINTYFESVFETGVDEMSWDDLSKNKMPWPSVAEVHGYRKQVYTTVSQVIASLTDEQCAAAGPDSPVWALAMSFEHERIHLETSSVLISELPQNLVKFPDHFPKYHASIPSSQDATQNPVASVHYPVNEMVSVASKTVAIGKPNNYPSFGWDNEYGYREYEVPAFSASKFKVSNGEFLEFVRDGGYAKRELWSDAGWEWRAYRNAKWPSFWVRSGPQGLHQFDLRAVFDTVPMPWSWPVSVNYHEADAYARWYGRKKAGNKNIRVMTELEHKAIRDAPEIDGNGRVVDPVMRRHDGGKVMIDGGVNTNLSCGSMNPVDAHKPNSQGFHDVFGNAWEWTSDYFCALPGFEVHPYYEDFSTPCFDGLHYVIQGGSFISTGNESSHFSRFHFRPHFFQHASFRVVEQLSPTILTSDTDAPGPFVGSYPYRRSDTGLKNAMKSSTNSLLAAEYEKLKHFGNLKRMQSYFGQVPSLSTISNIILNGAESIGIPLAKARAIDVGCGPGSMSFDLAAKVQSVIGIDHSLENIKLAKALQSDPIRGNFVTYAKAEGELNESITISPSTPRETSQIEFRMADPMCLPAEMMAFDIVVVNDVLDKMSSPNSMLGRLGGARGLVRSNGLLAITSSFTWNQNITPKSLWLGGYVDQKTGKEVSSFETLSDRLKSDFELIRETSQPVFWQESAKDYRCKFLSVSLWKRK